MKEKIIVFVFIGYKPQTDLLTGKVELDVQGYILTDDIDVFESERQRQDEVYELLLKY